MADDEATFLRCYSNFSDYPTNLIRNYDRQEIVEACSRYHRAHAHILFQRDESATFVRIRDYGQSEYELIVTSPKRRKYNLEHADQLVSHLEWPKGSEGCQDSSGPIHLHQDPTARFVLLEASNAQARKLNLTEEILLKILAYHQVSPYYLKLVTSFSYQARASDPNLGSFRCNKFLKRRGPCVRRLGRSGYHFQLAFQLTTFLGDKVKADDSITWCRYRAAVYHHFDVKEAKSFWIITVPLRPSETGFVGKAPRRTINHLWRKIKNSMKPDLIADDSPRSRLKASFQVLLSIGDWSLNAWCFYLHHIVEKIMEMLDEMDRFVSGEDVQRVNWWIFNLNDSILRLEGNAMVLKSLHNFYKSELLEEIGHLNTEDVGWLRECGDDIDQFADQLGQIIEVTDEILQKAKQIRLLAESRENYMQKLLQNQMNDRMNILSELSQKEASVMPIFQFITMIFLPVTVVSTIFSTDIVKYQGLPRGKDFSFSPVALWNWSITAILLTGTTLVVSEFWIRRDLCKVKRMAAKPAGELDSRTEERK